MSMSFFRLFLLSVFFACAEKPAVQNDFSGETVAVTENFPKGWEGKWAGELKIFSGSTLRQTLPMELHIFPIDSSDAWSWAIIYGEDKEAGKRDYILRPKDPEIGHWQIDEQNSIVLDAYFFGGKLIERFEVAGSLLMTTTELRGEKMVWEIVAGSVSKTIDTGNTIDGKDTVPEVKSYPITVMQRAELFRIFEKKDS